MTGEPRELQIPCCEISGDLLELERGGEFAEGGHMALRVYDHMKDGTNAILLDKEGARQLFNWLGVFLHT